MYIKKQSSRIQLEVFTTPKKHLNKKASSLAIQLLDNHLDLSNYKMQALQSSETVMEKKIVKGIHITIFFFFFCLTSVRASAAMEEVKRVLCFKSLVIILFSMGHISFAPENFPMVKNSLSFCQSSYFDEMNSAFSNVKPERMLLWS